MLKLCSNVQLIQACVRHSFKDSVVILSGILPGIPSKNHPWIAQEHGATFNGNNEDVPRIRVNIHLILFFV